MTQYEIKTATEMDLLRAVRDGLITWTEYQLEIIRRNSI